MDEKIAVAGTAPTSSSISFNPEYLKTSEGVLKIVQFLFGLVCWSLVASVGVVLFCNNLSAYQFVMFVGVTSWILTQAFLFIFLFSINSGAGSSLPWAVIEFGFNAFWGLFYFIASCVQSAYTCGSGNLLGASILAYIVALSYIIHANLSFRSWKGYFPWRGGGNQETDVKNYS